MMNCDGPGWLSDDSPRLSFQGTASSEDGLLIFPNSKAEPQPLLGCARLSGRSCRWDSSVLSSSVRTMKEAEPTVGLQATPPCAEEDIPFYRSERGKQESHHMYLFWKSQNLNK